LGDQMSQLDDAQLDYILGVIQDEDTPEDDALEVAFPIFQDSFHVTDDQEEEFREKLKLIIKKIKKPTSQVENNTEKKILSAPVNLAKIAKTLEDQVEAQLKNEMPAEININKMMEAKDTESVIDVSLSEEAQRERTKNIKKDIKREKKAIVREKRQALLRDEIIKKLSNKPVKLHAQPSDGNRQKDIRLENVSMVLGSLELLKDVSITLAEGRKYGLIGRNGMGKTTFLKHLASHAFPGIPSHLQILHIEQEVEASSDSVLQTILATDIEREELLAEEKELQYILDHEEKITSLKNEMDKRENKNNEGNGTAPQDGTTPQEGNNTTSPPLPDMSPLEKKILEDEFGHFEMTIDERNQRLAEIFQRLHEIDSDSAPARAAAILAGLGFTPEMQKQSTTFFSGGWRMRVALAQALFIGPDILLLDEPTNHLDLHAVLWLEDYLIEWNRTLVVVSHDRDFINNVVTDVVLIENKKLTRFKGNYDDYEKQKAELLRSQMKAQEAQEKEVAHLQEFIDKNRVRASTAKMAQSRMKKLEKMEMITINLPKDPTYNFTIPEPDLLQQPIFTIQDLSFGYEKNRILYTGVNVSISMNCRAALVGANGVGKSTFLKLVMGQLEPISGQVKLNPKATIARFTQHHQDQLDMKLSPLDWFKDMYPTTKPQDIRKHLGRFGIAGNLALQPIYSLSGGQKSRVAFAHVTWKKPQLLLLDEPTNHLDMETIDCLIRALNEFTGAVLIVSHDAHLISAVCDEIWVCENRQIRVFNGDFDDYRKMVSIQQHNAVKK